MGVVPPWIGFLHSLHTVRVVGAFSLAERRDPFPDRRFTPDPLGAR